MNVTDPAEVDPSAVIGVGALIADLVRVREYARIGPGSILGRGAYVGPGVVVGRNCIVQEYAVVYEPALLEDGVFVGAAAVFTNDPHPRAINADGSARPVSERSTLGVTVRTGASVGAHAVCLAPLTIGRWAMVAAGAIVTANVPDFALMVGVPAERVGWVGRSGATLEHVGDGVWVCPVTGERYRQHDGQLTLE
ncbi:MULTISPECIES: acyltransferase [unclassified Cryobacterium]|uniref:acyltransferase n=1 Tax=unclassified Cryobacterium TaxID=2649013 RepID=UPI00106971FA|nr:MULTISPECIES: acyltransferase [unclassified Cryobacterium]TFB98883.1 N-acetyltransferase [Cryobacterium sp. MDB2-A-1]TFC09087.1 N-acetyltransferase [Cryobacterium sp. MDB2-33-2]TFC14867.1 N-acetyltransferase [Cryobacterium sp. MDB2-A-2]TFC16499.1 N-acetyltransferase [Cryobacterium sp. MDB2-10]